MRNIDFDMHQRICCRVDNKFHKVAAAAIKWIMVVTIFYIAALSVLFYDCNEFTLFIVTQLFMS